MAKYYTRDEAHILIGGIIDILGGASQLGYENERESLVRNFNTKNYIEAYNSLNLQAVNEYFDYFKEITRLTKLPINEEIQNSVIANEDERKELQQSQPKFIIAKQIVKKPEKFNCDIFAWNLALENGFDPRAQQDNFIWDGNRLDVPRIYEKYPTGRTSTPVEGTSGYIFHNIDNDGIPHHMEFYDFRNGGDNYIRYSTEGKEPPIAESWEKNRPLPWGDGVYKGKGIFISLNRL